MRRANAGRRHMRPVSLEPPVGGGSDDLTTWSSTGTLETMVLPGTVASKHTAIVDVTNYIPTAARNDTGALRFTRGDGVRLGHFRTTTNRILLSCEFHGGINTINYYWGKVGATQPGLGFPASADIFLPYRLALIFEEGIAKDLSASPATFTTVGTPTITTGIFGQAMQFANGSYLQTTAAKLRADARVSRSIFSLVRMNAGTEEQGRIVCWADWATNNRALQLWIRPDGLELYVADEAGAGVSWNRWFFSSLPKVGWNTIGCSWLSGSRNATLLMNHVAEVLEPDFPGTPGNLYNANTPYIVGGTPVTNYYFSGLEECRFELTGSFESADHLAVWSYAWGEPDTFWGIADRTPDNFDVPELTSQPLNTEVSFAPKQITGIAAGTRVSVDGDGTPSYSVGSAIGIPTDIKAKGSTDGTIGPGNWLFSHHRTSTAYSTVVESNVTVGTVQSKRKSTTIPSPSTPPDSGVTPGGPATFTVNTISAFNTAFSQAKGGDIIEFTAGDYKSQGKLTIQNKSLIGGPPIVVRASTLAYRGYTSAKGGLLVADETFFTTGSGGAEFSSIMLRNIHNIVFIGIRTYTGNVGTAGAKNYGIDVIGCTFLKFWNCKICGFKPTTAKKLWANDIYRPNNGWWNQTRGMQLGISAACSDISFKDCLVHFHGDIGFYNANSPRTLFEDCVFSDQMSDHIRNDGSQTGFTAKRCIFYRTWGVKSSSGGIAHQDHCQNTTKTQTGWQNHVWDDCIFASGDAAYPHVQCIFYECDNYPTYPRGSGVYVTNCVMETRAPNSIYNRPGDKLIVTNCMVLQTQFGGLNELKEDGTGSLIDTTFNNPVISVSSTTTNGKSFGTNKIDRSLYHTHDFNTGIGDQIVQSMLFRDTGTHNYSHLVDYPLYTGPRTQWPPVMSAASWRPVLLLDSNYVMSTTQLGRWAPKATAAIHPNQTGYHIGASKLFQDFGVLP